MNDREKVMKGLECCKSRSTCNDKCPYYHIMDDPNFGMDDCTSQLAADALSLLKAQEPEPVSIKDSDGGETHWYVCRSCKAPINPGDKYCHECGRAVKWDG